MIHANPLQSHLVKGSALTTDGERTRLQKTIFEAMIGFCTSNNVHARCIAQWYVKKMFEDPIFKAFIPSGCDIVYNFLALSKDTKSILKKYDRFITEF